MEEKMKRHITTEQLAEVKKIDLLTYLSNYEPNELVRLSSNDYVTRTHSSLHISNGMWCWWVKNIGGKTALDYLIKVEEMSFLDAALLIHECITNEKPKIMNSYKRKADRFFYLPPSAETNEKVIHYLVNERCIDRGIVDYYISLGMIYEEKNNHSVIFVGYNNDYKPRYAFKRDIVGNGKRDIYGSDKSYSFSLSSKDSNSLHIFESAIEVLSYQTLLKRKHKEWKNDNYLSLSGATTIGSSIEESDLPIALYEFLRNNENIREIYVHTNNDRAGFETYQKIYFHLSKKFDVYNKIPKHSNDINEQLILNTHKKKNVNELIL